MSTQHTHEWTPTTNGYACTECDTTSPQCINGAHPTGTSLLICDPCLRAEQRVLDDIDRTLHYWDDRDRNRERSPMAFDVVRAHSNPNDRGVTTPEDVHHELLAWAIRWAAHAGANDPGQTPAAYLKTRLLWAAQNPSQSQWPTYRAATRGLRWSTRAIVGITPDRHPEKCMYCGGKIVQDRADQNWRPYPDGRQDAVRCTNPDCATTWGDTDDFRRNNLHHVWALPQEHPDQLVTIDQATQIFPDVPRSTFRYWIHEDRKLEIRAIPEKDWNEKGEPRYRLADLNEKAQRRTETTRRGRPAQVIAG